jgi:hypothetical protein
MSDEESRKKSFDEREHFVVRMGVFMPEGLVPDDARRISVRHLVDKDHLTQSVITRSLVAYAIRERAEELITAIYDQMDRQEKASG